MFRISCIICSQNVVDRVFLCCREFFWVAAPGFGKTAVLESSLADSEEDAIKLRESKGKRREGSSHNGSKWIFKDKFPTLAIWKCNEEAAKQTTSTSIVTGSSATRSALANLGKKAKRRARQSVKIVSWASRCQIVPRRACRFLYLSCDTLAMFCICLDCVSSKPIFV